MSWGGLIVTIIIGFLIAYAGILAISSISCNNDMQCENSKPMGMVAIAAIDAFASIVLYQRIVSQVVPI